MQTYEKYAVGLLRQLDRRAAPAFLAALREDRLAEWAAANPGRVTALDGQR